jgi:hypothetical protein
MTELDHRVAPGNLDETVAAIHLGPEFLVHQQPVSHPGKNSRTLFQSASGLDEFIVDLPT